mgnify:CR=1 FL=1
MATVKHVFRHAARSERPTDPVSETVSHWIRGTSEIGLSEKVQFQGLYGEVLAKDQALVEHRVEFLSETRLLGPLHLENDFIPQKLVYATERA